MIRKRYELIGSFWSDVAQSLGLENVQVHSKRPLIKSVSVFTPHLVGRLSGFTVEAGVHYSAHRDDPAFTYGAVIVDGLPPGFEIGPWKTNQPRRPTSPSRIWIACDEGGGREVRPGRPGTISVESDGLVTEYAGFDFDTFLTSRRVEVICSLDGDLHWVEGSHQLRIMIPELPYPNRRDFNRTARGDSDATQKLWASREKIVGLVRVTVREAEVVVRDLREDRDSG